ncbi:MAG: UDP-N-acetylmuramoyl-L-alanyl-D-glutamate--2,6-diaminopimelate ligase, partial [Proteobacteria bacterium]|nr:UDP-N-acetylmuramoyl-L-alanyl-D-glutamate--2,6-diaminopimelate ligase [Pseudomonadota bacterium]
TGNTLFVAIPGSRVDGHDFLEAVYRAGVKAFVTQRPFYKPDASTIVVPDARYALSRLAAEFYGNPSQQVTLIGITGTNGKTTITYLLEGILREAGYPVGVLSTVEYRFGSCRQASWQTTLEPMELQKILREMMDAGIRYVVMEVSSQGLDQRRVDGCAFDVGIFTNLTPEHLDYHETLDRYYTSKERFFTHVLAGSSKKSVRAVINQDDPMGRVLLGKLAVPSFSFGITGGTINTRNIAITPDGIRADIITPGGTVAIRSPLLGMFNLYNIMAAVGTALSLAIPPETISSGIEHVSSIPGRMERVENRGGFLVLVDYAHTGDALENVLKTVQGINAGSIITVFGCGGDRDRDKRTVMGRIGARYSDIVIITSDNPRSEAPGDIIREIEAGIIEQGLPRAADHLCRGDIPAKAYFVFEDRSCAIHKAISLAQPGDVVLIAGKGHETTQQTGDKKLPFDDREVARLALGKNGHC